MNFTRTTHHLSLITAATAALLLTACASDNRTVGQKIDAAIATSERTADRAGAETARQISNAKGATERTADTVGDKVEKVVDTVSTSVADAAITTSINAELARDPKLSVFRIDVDTSNGRVTLSGTAPDADSRLRATKLAGGVKGVTHVENRLKVGG